VDDAAVTPSGGSHRGGSERLLRMSSPTTGPLDDATRPSLPAGRGVVARVGGADWAEVAQELDQVGIADAGRFLAAAECRSLAKRFDEPAHFRSTVDMARHRFGSGRYRYFADPLPPQVDSLRRALWPQLLPIARSWAERLGRDSPWPDSFDDCLATCHRAGQSRPTPLLLRYGPGDWNALHQDLYGELVFPLQVVIGLDRPGVDHRGGEFVVVEQRPRAQSRATVMATPQGHALVFATRDRPVRSTRGWSRAPMRHGLSRVTRGSRHALGVIFHGAT